jgi:hypothetical protein
MIQRRRIFIGALLVGALLAGMCLSSLTGAEAAPKPKATPTFTPTPMPPLPPGNYYVSVNGSDANPGTLALPWRHIQYALGRVGAGSTVYVQGGLYNELVTFSNSGSPTGGYITLQNYAGQVPIIDATGLPISGETAVVNIVNREYVRLIGFEIRNLKAGGVSSAFPQGISVRGNGAYIEIRNNRVHDIENSCRRCGAHGIAVYGRDPNASIHDLVIDGNEVYNGKFGWSESLVLNGNVEKFTVSNNIVHDNDNIGIDFIGFEGENPNPEVDRARDGVVFGNLVYINSYGNRAYGNERSADGIYVDGGTNILIERNIVHHTNLGIELASEHRGKNTSYITLRNNFLYANTQAGIAFGGYDTRRGSTENCVIVNNTLYNNFTQGDWGAELYIQYDTRNNIVKNNLIFANSFRRYIESWSAVMTGNVVDRNLYFATGGGTAGTWIWQGTTYSTFDAYRAASGNDGTGLIGSDPLLLNPTAGDLHINTGSPAINAGDNLTTAQVGTADIDGGARINGGTIDVGADEK